ncbi:MAG: class I SAM-dependent methyltransferase [Pseudomonadota bacterium]
MVANVSASDWSTDRGEAWRESMGPLEAMLAPVNTPLIEALDLDAPYRIADIGCGGGETSIAMARNAYPGSTVDGFDISPALVDAAKRKEAYGDVPIHFHVQDAGQPLSEPAQFDRLISRFGIMFFPDADHAFTNLVDWLKPGGRFAFAVWGSPSENPWMSSIRSVLSNHIVLPTPEPGAPGPFRYHDVDGFISLLDASGFADIKSGSWKDQLPLGGGLSAEAAASFALEAFSIGQLLNQSDQITARAAHSELASLFSKHLVDDQVRMDAHVHIVTGTRLSS